MLRADYEDDREDEYKHKLLPLAGAFSALQFSV